MAVQKHLLFMQIRSTSAAHNGAFGAASIATDHVRIGEQNGGTARGRTDLDARIP